MRDIKFIKTDMKIEIFKNFNLAIKKAEEIAKSNV